LIPIALVAVCLLPMLMALAFILGRRYAPRGRQPQLSPVSRQHFELFQGGELNPLLVESAKTRLRTLLERGDHAAIEATFRPGEQFVIHVRALAEIGTDAAGQILERQLKRHFSDDHLEQTWYRIDVVSGLRQLNREESLPHLLRCAEFAEHAPLGPVFAAETISFLGFGSYLKQPTTPLGSAALRLLHRVLEGFRICLPPQVAVETRLGEMIEAVWDSRPTPADPLVVRVLAETRRYLRRLPVVRKLVAEEPADREAFFWQSSRIEAIEPALNEYLGSVGPELARQLTTAHGDRSLQCLIALRDLRAECGSHLLPIAAKTPYEGLEPVIEALTWSSDERVGPWLCRLIHANVPLDARSRRARGPIARRRYRVSPQFPYEATLRALRRHYSRTAEAILLLAARDPDHDHRLAALTSFGWFEPFRTDTVIDCLEANRRHAHADIRRAARAALARLGERSALHWFRQGLSSDDSQHVHEAIHAIAAEGMTLLWPDLDRLIDSDDAEIAFHAGEAIVLLSEQMAT
jgi:hypothetical protein